MYYFYNFLIKNIQTNNNVKSHYTNEICNYNISNNNCYITFDNSTLKNIHIIATRFLMEIGNYNGFPNKLYSDEYVINGIRVMKKYLFTSLINQSSKNFFLGF